MSEWLCLTDIFDYDFIKGCLYKVNKEGRLLDEDGDPRMPPAMYMRGCFKEIPLNLENV